MPDFCNDNPCVELAAGIGLTKKSRGFKTSGKNSSEYKDYIGKCDLKNLACINALGVQT